jgi:hypothetical protein
MKDMLKVVSTIALLSSLLAVWTVLTGNGQPTLLLWVSWVLALAVGIMSAVHASRLRRPGWSATFALVTVFIGASASAALAEILAHPDGFFPSPAEANLVPVIMTFAEVLPPFVALLSAFLLRPGRRKTVASVDF